MASSHAAASTTNTCSATPTSESTNRAPPWRMAPRTARPTTTPAISPITTRARIRNSVANNLVRPPSSPDEVRGQQYAGHRAEDHAHE